MISPSKSADSFRCLDCNATFRRGWCPCGKSHAEWDLYPNYFTATGRVALANPPLPESAELTRESTAGEQATAERQTRGEE